MSQRPALRDADLVWRSCWRRRVGSAFSLGGFAVAYFITMVLGSGLFELDGTRTEQVVLAVTAALFISVEYPLAVRRSRRFFRPVQAWLDGDAPLTPETVERLHALPRHHARGIGLEWGACTAIGLAIHTMLHPFSPSQAILLLPAGPVFALYLSWIVYLLVEAGLRPEFSAAAAVLPAHPEPSHSIAARLGRTALLCTLVLVFWFIVLVSWPADQGFEVLRATAPATAFVLTTVVGLTLWSIRSTSSTIVGLKDGLDRVENGDLSVRLPVGDRTELGALQQSFNRMVIGLQDRDLLERLLQGQVGHGVAAVSREHGQRITGDRRIVSVLFVDLIGSTSLTRQLSPEVMLDLLNSFFDVVVRTVDEHDGELLQFQGDGAICLFGAPHHLDRHARQALRAARSLRRRLDDFGATHPGVDAAIAISTGAVVVGHLGTDERYTYSAIGDAVNEASRLLDMAKGSPGHIVASREAVESAEDERAAWVPAGEATLRGREVPAVYYRPRVVCASDAERADATGSAGAGVDPGR